MELALPVVPGLSANGKVGVVGCSREHAWCAAAGRPRMGVRRPAGDGRWLWPDVVVGAALRALTHPAAPRGVQRTFVLLSLGVVVVCAGGNTANQGVFAAGLGSPVYRPGCPRASSSGGWCRGSPVLVLGVARGGLCWRAGGPSWFSRWCSCRRC
jgi:hypothetical protein